MLDIFIPDCKVFVLTTGTITVNNILGYLFLYYLNWIVLKTITWKVISFLLEGPYIYDTYAHKNADFQTPPTKKDKSIV